MLWLVLAAVALLGTHGALQLASERQALESAASRELSLVGAAVAAAAEAARRDGQGHDILALFERLSDPTVALFLVDEQQQLIVVGGDESLLPRLAPATIAPGVPARRGDWLALRLPVGDGHLVLARRLDAMASDLSGEARALVQITLALALALAGIIGLVVHLRLRRPLREVVVGMRAVAAGNLDIRPNPAGAGEVAELGAELGKMVQRLADAREALLTETQARQQLEAELQRAHRLVLVGELAAVLAHEIGSPLQVLGGRARGLAGDERLPEPARKSATIIAEQSDRVAGIVGQLLGVARRPRPRLEATELSVPVRAIVDLLGPHARRSGVALTLTVASEVWVLGDRDQLQQVVLNLVQNGLRAAGDRGAVEVSVGQDGLFAVLAVEDSGPGIDEAVRDQIFEPFRTFWPAGGGTGLGLSVVRSIVQDHGGTLQLAAAACTRIEVRLPPLGQK